MIKLVKRFHRKIQRTVEIVFTFIDEFIKYREKWILISVKTIFTKNTQNMPIAFGLIL